MQWMEVKKGSAIPPVSFKRPITKRRIFATCGSNRPRLKYGHSENHNLQRTMEKAETFNGVLAASEKEAEAFFKRASEYYDKGNYDRAIADFTEAIRLKPDFVEAYQGRGDAYASGWTNITDLEHHRDRADAAIADYSEVIRLKPDAESYKNRGEFYYLYTDDLDRAIADCTEAIRIAPDVPEYYRLRERIYRDAGMLEEANADREVYAKLTKQ